MERLETRGPEIGVCNICGVTSKLTEDHIPPKGVPLVGQAYLSRLVDSLSAERMEKAPRPFQRGVKYRSICAECNNRRLGAHYDPTLVSYCNGLHLSLARNIYAPVSLDVKINRLLRAFVGHLLAHGINQHRMGRIQSVLSDYFLCESERFPSEFFAYCWIYPYKPQIVGHGLGVIFDFRSRNSPFVASVMKFYPIAFMCATDELPLRERQNVLRVDQISSGDIDAIERITLSQTMIPPMMWPEVPGDHGAVFHNKLGTIAFPASKK